MDNLKIFIETFGQIYVGQVLEEDASTFKVKDLMMINANTVKQGERVGVNLLFYPVDLIASQPNVFLYRMLDPTYESVVTLQKTRILQVVENVPKTLVDSYETWIGRFTPKEKSDKDPLATEVDAAFFQD